MKSILILVISGAFAFGNLYADIPLALSENVKVVIFVPETHANAVREAMAKSGAGKIGNYDSCSFSIKGIGRYRPLKGANPAIGEVGQLEMTCEERIEAICPVKCVKDMISAVKKAHPYEEMGYDIYPLLELPK